MSDGTLNIDSREPQIVEGEFLDRPSWGEIESTCEIRMDRYHLYESEVKFEGYVPHGDEPIVYLTKNKIQLHLSFSGSYSTHTFFTIEKVTFPTVEDLYLKSGTVNDQVYFPDKFELLGYQVFRKEHRFRINDRPKSEMYFFIPLGNEIQKSDKERLLLSLSVLSCTHLTEMEYCSGNEVTISRLKSNSTEVLYYGSGILYYPITIRALEKVVNSVSWDKLYRVFLAYANYCTTTNPIYELYKGCSILEYLVDLFWRNLNISSTNTQLKKAYKKYRRSAKLLGVLTNLPLDDKEVEFISLLFPDLDLATPMLPGKFEFFELRDRHIHRGELLLSDSDFKSYWRALASLNELIRLLIPHIYLITDWQMPALTHMKTESLETFVEKRQKIMGFKIDQDG